MNILSLIAVTVLVTLISGTLIGFLIYVGVVVGKLKQTAKVQSEDISNLQTSLSESITGTHKRIDELMDETNDRFNSNNYDLSLSIEEVNKKIDSRYDKLLSKIDEEQHKTKK